ncbi:M1 family metallopeptidase [Lutimonas zeaxanthinifaciens]|uniref:M1 family metallopeptidase n=1 Tax=Lutimonas zeaxanthinifaciens TaxID=3060215 RepID=UPI00265CB7A8|nr:M1 family metallopeptidase [Lutimonas sp. YSD2104]WKK66856.1 M1 family metallopeptidase [Lutimonas sp. YSD2104]
MKKLIVFATAVLISLSGFAQQTGVEQNDEQQGHYNISKFRQLKQELPTPNTYRTASGAPGHEYYQQKADYKMDIILDDENQRIYGEEVITYYNNSPDELEYLWVQLDQNIRAPDAKTNDVKGAGPSTFYRPKKFTEEFLGKPFPGGFNIDYVKSNSDNDLPYTINGTMMRIDLPAILKSGENISFKIKWWYNIPNHVIDGGRSGFEHFEDGNNNYVIAQFFPRMAVYNDVEGWQNMQFLGRGEFALVFGDYEVNITTPEDHILDGTGVITNRKEMLTGKQWRRYEKALKSYDEPVIIVTQEEAEENEKTVAKGTKTWKLKAENVRDFAFASSRKYILDGQAVKLGDRTVMAISLYSKEGNPLWEEYSTRVVASTVKSYSAQMFDYPYHKAISVHAQRQGMEYPMICFNFGRPKPDGTYTERTRNGMIGVIIHEVGHNWFPMIVNSDERQWGWMDEGLNTFAQLLAEQDFEPGFPSRGYPKNVVSYMSGDQSRLAPIMTQHDNVFNSGSNAYSKPAAGLYILREVVMGHDLFDKAFKTYAERWRFKHPTPADFFRTMEDASGVDLDWFWRGWFYTTHYNDIGIKDIKMYQATSEPTERAKRMGKRYGMSDEVLRTNYLYLAEMDPNDMNGADATKSLEENTALSEYLADNFSKEEREKLRDTKYFYEIIFEKPGGLVMPILAEITYEDGTVENKYYPAEIWRFNDKEVKKVLGTEKKITGIKIDPNGLTADVNTDNNSWPREESDSKFESFKKKSLSN